jgi:hypothetical protein
MLIFISKLTKKCLTYTVGLYSKNIVRYHPSVYRRIIKRIINSTVDEETKNIVLDNIIKGIVSHYPLNELQEIKLIITNVSLLNYFIDDNNNKKYNCHSSQNSDSHSDSSGSKYTEDTEDIEDKEDIEDTEDIEDVEYAEDV